jgi:prefoldin subunit 5
MSKEISKPDVSLESISKSIDGLVMQVRTLATKNEVIEMIKPLATKTEVVELIKPLATTQLVDDLAIAVKNGFDRVDKKLEEMDERFDKVDETIDTLDKKVTRIDTRLTNGLDNVLLHYAQRVEFDQLDVRCKKLERRVFA